MLHKGLIAAGAVLGLMFGYANTADAAIALVTGQKGIQGGNGGTGETSIAITLNGTTAGNLLIISPQWCSDATCKTTGGSISSISGASCAQATGAKGDNSTGANETFTQDIWLCKNIPGGNVTATVNYSGTLYWDSVRISEWSGASTTAPDDGIGNHAGTQAANSISVATNGNTTVSGDLIYAACVGQSHGLTAGQTLVNTDGVTSYLDEYQIAGAAGSYTDSCTDASVNNQAMVISLVAIKPPATAATAVSLSVATGTAIPPSTCPDADGSASPSPGTPQYSSVAALKGGGSYSVQINGSGVGSLGCKVAGVDYHVGLSTSQTLSDPSTGTLPAGCTYGTQFGQAVTCIGNNGTYQGWDHTLHGGIGFYDGGNGWTITNNKFAAACPQTPFSAKGPGSPSVGLGGTTTITYNTFTGASGTCPNAGDNADEDIKIADGATVIFEWNYMLNAAEDFWGIAGPTAGGTNGTFTGKYNLFDTQGWQGHPDGTQFQGGNITPTISHNTYREVNGRFAQPMHVEAQLGSAITNATVSYNTIVTPPTGTANFDIACKADGAGNTNSGFSAYGNYIDASGATEIPTPLAAPPWSDGTTFCTSFSFGTPYANYRMDTGNACSGTTCN